MLATLPLAVDVAVSDPADAVAVSLAVEGVEPPVPPLADPEPSQ